MIALRVLEFLNRAGKYRGTLRSSKMGKIIYEGGVEVEAIEPNKIMIRSDRADIEIVLKEISDVEAKTLASKIYSIVRVLGGLKR